MLLTNNSQVMIENLNNWDTSLFWWINSHHAPIVDWVLWTFSQAWSWPIVIIAAMIIVCKHIENKRWWMVVIGICLCFLLGDRISVMCFKDVVMRPRPCHALEGVRMFMTSCGGKYGFVSSHAANSTAIAIFLSLLSTIRIPSKKNPKLLPYAMAAWVLLIGYSRPYLGKHYPGDVICGTILGLAIGAFVFFLFCQIDRKIFTLK